MWLFIAGLVLSGSVFAQVNDSLPMQTITLEDVSIVDFKNDNYPVFKSKELSVSSQANKSGSDLGDLLQNTIPVYFKNYSVGGVKTIDFRGTGSERTKVYWNGIPVNSPTLGGFDFSLLPYYFVEDARLRFGGASLTDGGGGLGGSVQLVNPVRFKNNSIELSAAYGSFGSYTLGGKALVSKGKFKSDSRVLFKGAQNNYTFINDFKKGHPTENRVHNEVSQLGFQQVFAYRINPRHSLSARVVLTESERNLPPPVSSTSKDGAWQKDNLFLSQLAWDWVPKSVLYLKVRSGFQNQENRFVLDNVVDAKTRVQAWNNNVDFGYYGFKKLKLSTTLSFDRYWVNSDGVGQVIEDQFSGLINADWQLLQQLKIVIGARTMTITGSSSPTMPYGGVVWQVPKNSGNFRANISQVYRFPTINDRYWKPGGNPDLNPENGWNYELGYDYKNKFGKIDIEFGLGTFYSLVNQWILWQPSVNNPFIWEAQNIWKVNNKGVEVNLKTGINFSETNNLIFRINYTYASTTVAETKKNDSGVVGKQLILTPKHQIIIPIELYLKDFNASVIYRFVSKRYTDRLNKNALDPYNLIDLVMGYQFKKPRFHTNFRIDNVLSTIYETIPGQPLPGITFNLELTWKIL